MFSSEKFWRRRIFAVTWLTYAGFYLCRKNFAVAMPILAEKLGSTTLDFATVIFIYSLFYAIGQFANAVAGAVHAVLEEGSGNYFFAGGERVVDSADMDSVFPIRGKHESWD